MKSVASIALVAAVANAQNKTNSTTCTSILDPASPLYSYLKPYLKDEDVRGVIAELPESWQSCIGSLDINSVVTDVLAAFTTQQACVAAAPFLMPLVTGSSGAKPNKTSADITAPQKSSMPSWLNVSDADVQQLCTPLVKSILPCVNSAVLTPLFKQINSNQCCTKMIAEVKAYTGNAPDVFVDNALKLSSNVVCATQAPGFNGATNQSCGYSWYKSFLNGVESKKNTSVLETRVMAAIQVPNDQGCAAVQGESFKSTTGAAVPSLFTKPIVPGSCVRPADDLLTWVRKFPVWQNYTLGTVRPLDLFEDGKCINGTEITKSLGRDADKWYDFLGLPQKAIESSCFHLANGAFGTCKFSDSLTGLPKDNTTTPSATPKVSSSEVATASLVASSLALMTLTW